MAPRRARIEAVERAGPGAHRVVLDVRGRGVSAEPGDRCALPPDPRLHPVSSVTDGARIELTVERLGAAVEGAEVAVEVVEPVGFSLPTDPTIPIVMLAEGIGLAPFAAFIEARPGMRNLLFACGELPHRERLAGYAASGQAEVHIVPRVDAVLREAADLAALMRSRSEGGAGARIYVCGGPTFAREMMAAVAGALGEPLHDLIVQHRYMQLVLPAPAAGPATEIDASELARHTGAADTIWAAIDGRVYDLSAFAEIHPGGEKLIRSFAGMDCTASYRIVEHHRDPAVQALLSVFEIGVLRQLDVGPLDDLFRRWVRTLYGLAEVENAHGLDTSIEAEPLNRAELADGPARTPYRLQFAIEAHGRFVGQTIPIVCRAFDRLWAATTDTGALGDELGRIQSGPEARGAREACRELERALERDGATPELDSRLRELRIADAAYLGAAKALVGAGVRTFELHGVDALVTGREELLGSLRGLPALTRERLGMLAGVGV
jgi:sulfite reductase (NADPH) flavoprotein alpha-component